MVTLADVPMINGYVKIKYTFQPRKYKCKTIQ